MMSTYVPSEITNNDDAIDSRDIIARIEYLQSLTDHEAGLKDWEQEELSALLALAEEASQYAADWEYGETLIRDSYFEDHARELADDIGAVNPNASWPLTYIDWSAAAEALKIDYTAVDFAGVTYWIR
jgi:hypothetical protein